MEPGREYLDALASRSKDSEIEGEWTVESMDAFFDEAFKVLEPYNNHTVVDLSRREHIASGSYGSVYSVGRLAVKAIPFERDYLNYHARDYPYPTNALRELYIMSLISGGPNIVSLDSFSRLGDWVHIYMERADKSLTRILYDDRTPTADDWDDVYIKGHRPMHPPVDIDTALRYTDDIISGVQYMHSLGILHMDIKPLNILRSHDGSLRLCDFGSSTLLTGTSFQTHFDGLGTERYDDITILRSNGYPSPYVYTKDTDWWSVGCVVVEIAVGMPMVLAMSDGDDRTPLIECIERVLYAGAPFPGVDGRLRHIALRFLRAI